MIPTSRDLAGALERLCAARSVGRVHLRDGGIVQVTRGRIVHAVSGDRRSEGTRALRLLLEQGAPVVGVSTECDDVRTIPDAPGEFTLLEALRQNDERRHSRHDPRRLVGRLVVHAGIDLAGVLGSDLTPITSLPTCVGWERPFLALLQPALRVARELGPSAPVRIEAATGHRRLLVVRLEAGFACCRATGSEARDAALDELAPLLRADGDPAGASKTRFKSPGTNRH